jgi:hypothetical protein
MSTFLKSSLDKRQAKVKKILAHAIAFPGILDQLKIHKQPVYQCTHREHDFVKES